MCFLDYPPLHPASALLAAFFRIPLFLNVVLRPLQVSSTSFTGIFASRLVPRLQHVLFSKNRLYGRLSVCLSTITQLIICSTYSMFGRRLLPTRQISSTISVSAISIVYIHTLSASIIHLTASRLTWSTVAYFPCGTSLTSFPSSIPVARIYMSNIPIIDSIYTPITPPHPSHSPLSSSPPIFNTTRPFYPFSSSLIHVPPIRSTPSPPFFPFTVHHHIERIIISVAHRR